MEISNWNDLDAIRYDLDGDYILVNNLDENTAGYDEHVGVPDNGWEPIGQFDEDEDMVFSGSFDGNGHKIRNLRINRPDTSYVGLFSAVELGSITNLALVDIAVTGDSRVGGLVGYNWQSEIESSITSGRVTGDSRVGGLVGWNSLNGGIVSSTASDVTVTSNREAGGLVGLNNSEITWSTASGDVTGEGNFTGGLVGANISGKIEWSTASGNVTGERYTGGLAGWNENEGEIRESVATGAVTGDSRVGGLVGSNQSGNIESSLATGAVTGDSQVGGLVGGGFIDDGKIESSIATGTVTGDSRVGGLVGLLNVVLRDVYWDVTTTSQNDPVGENDDGRLEGDVSGLSTVEIQGESAEQNMPGLDFEDTWQVVADPNGYPTLQSHERTEANDSDSDEGGIGSEPPTTDLDLHERLQEATVAERITINGEEYFVLTGTPDEPDDKLGFTDEDYRLLEPNAAVNVAISYQFCSNYRINNQRRLEYTNNQYEEYGNLESMATAANLLSELSGVLALTKVSPGSAASNAVDTLQVAVDWGERRINDPYHEQFARMATASDVVDWSNEHTPHPGASLLDVTDEALDLTGTLIDTYQAVDGIQEVAVSASTVRDVFSAADGIRDNVSPSAVDGVNDLKHAGYTALASMATDATVDAVSGIAEAQTRAAAMGQGQAAARRPLLTELVELEKRANDFDLGPAGILRIHTLHQADYQIESAALYGQASIIEEYQSSGLGSIISRINDTGDTPEIARERAETYRDLSQLRGAVTGQTFEIGIEEHSDSLNAEVYGEQTLL